MVRRGKGRRRRKRRSYKIRLDSLLMILCVLFVLFLYDDVINSNYLTKSNVTVTLSIAKGRSRRVHQAEKQSKWGGRGYLPIGTAVLHLIS